MAYWNHRVVKRIVGGYPEYGIHEVYYNDDGSIQGYTDRPVSVASSELGDLRVTLERMLACLEKEVLIDGEVQFTHLPGVAQLE